jgi:CheY-like chemotaxis protein
MEESPLPDQRRSRVLVVDNERANAETLAIIISRRGFETAVAYDGQEAVEKATYWRPDALVSDVMMPRLNGIEAAIQIATLLPACRIVLLSGQAATSDLVKTAELKGHFFEILPKPIHPQELLDHLKGL